jgi:hypothetical protein
MIDMDCKIIADLATTPSERLIAMNRLQGIMADMPSATANKEARDVLKKIKDDKALMNEIAAFAMLTEYIGAMKKVPAKKATETQAQWLGGINAKFAGTYAAEIASKIKKCSKIE